MANRETFSLPPIVIQWRVHSVVRQIGFTVMAEILKKSLTLKYYYDWGPSKCDARKQPFLDDRNNEKYYLEDQSAAIPVQKHFE